MTVEITIEDRTYANEGVILMYDYKRADMGLEIMYFKSLESATDFINMEENAGRIQVAQKHLVAND